MGRRKKIVLNEVEINEGEPKLRKRGRPKKQKHFGAELTEVGTLKLKKEQLLKWRMLEAEVNDANSKVQLANLILQNTIRENPSVSKAMTTVDSLKRALGEKHREYVQYMNELNETIGVDLSKCAIDDQTGMVRELHEEGK